MLKLYSINDYLLVLNVQLHIVFKIIMYLKFRYFCNISRQVTVEKFTNVSRYMSVTLKTVSRYKM